MMTRTIDRPESPYSQSLLAVDVWSTITLTFSFPTMAQYTGYDAQSTIFDGFAPFTDIQKTAVRAAFTQLEAFTNLTFVEISGNSAGSATLRFANTADTDTAFAFLPSEDAIGGDSWYSTDLDLQSPQLGNYAYLAVLHEIGHTLGLVHPHEPEVGEPMDAERDWLAFTVMSYRSAPGGPEGYYNGQSGFAQSYMIEDIAALQHAYGANFSTNSGDTVYRFDGQTGETFVNGVSQGKPLENVIFITIWDGSGNDTYDFSTKTEGGTIDLNPGEWSRFYPSQLADLGSGGRPPGQVANALLYEGDKRSLIENAIGGSGDDTILGNIVANKLEGGLGRDILYGYDGDDFLYGGDGLDQLYGGAGADNIFGGAGNDTIEGGDGRDVLLGETGDDSIFGGSGDDKLIGGDGSDSLNGGDGVDELQGGPGRDGLFGGNGADILSGGDDDDTLNGGAGADKMIGGKGDDTYVVDNAGDILVELAGEGSDSIETPFDIVLPDNFENASFTSATAVSMQGNSADNKLIGNDANNIINGGAGADKMSGQGGNDTYYVDNIGDTVGENPGGGSDTVYASVSFAIARGIPASGNPYTGASLPRATPPSDIETLILTGVANINATGNEINNTIKGNAGANILTGAEGNDVLDGGANIDIAVFSGNQSEYTLTQTSVGKFTVVGPDGTDTLTGIEYLRFDDSELRLLPGTGTIVNFDTNDPSAYRDAMSAIRDFDGTSLGNAARWLRIGAADVNGDGDIDQLLVNRTLGRFATVGTAEDGKVYFSDYGWAGETRIAGIYIDPLVTSGAVAAGSDNDSQRRFQNDLQIENINRVLGAGDFDGDGLQEVYFGLTDGSAFLHAYMHADGNIQYANYQSQQQVIDYLSQHGFGSDTYGEWFT